MRRASGAHTPDLLLRGFAVNAGMFVVALIMGWDVLEMVTGIILLLLVAALSFRALLWSVWPFRLR